MNPPPNNKINIKKTFIGSSKLSHSFKMFRIKPYPNQHPDQLK